MLWATIAMAIATAFGVYWVRDTLIAANKSNQIMRDEQRPWLKLEAKVELIFTDHSKTIAVHIPIKNVGRLPARNLRVGSIYVYENSPSEDQIEEKFDLAQRIASSGKTKSEVIFPDTHVNASAYHIEYITLKGGDSRFYTGVICAVIYEDNGAKIQSKCTNGYFRVSILSRNDSVCFGDVTDKSEIVVSVEEIKGRVS